MNIDTGLNCFDVPYWTKCSVMLSDRIAAVSFNQMGTRARQITGVAESGDVSFNIDSVAERTIESFVKSNEIPVAVFSEDAGLIKYRPNPKALFVVDPIDGSRPAGANLEPPCG